MATLTAEKRDASIKAKKLRREGFTTGILYGRDMKDSQPLKFPEKEALQFIKSNKEGSQVELDVEGVKTDALVKSIDYDPISKKIMAMDFQALVAGEKVNATAQIKVLNADKLDGYFVEEEMSSFHYKADPSHLIDTIEIDVTKFKDQKNICVSDLDISKDSNIDLQVPEDAIILHIAEKIVQTDDEDAEDSETAAE